MLTGRKAVAYAAVLAITWMAGCMMFEGVRQLSVVRAAVGNAAGPGNRVSVDLTNGRYLGIAIESSKRPDQQSGEKRDTALAFAKTAYAAYALRSSLERVAITFQSRRTYFLFLTERRAADGDIFSFRSSELIATGGGDRAMPPPPEVEVNLRGGFLVLRHTDLFIDDELPLVFTRCFRMWDTQSRAFGIGWNHPYDILPVGSRNPYTYLDLILPDGDAIHYNRISEGTGYADAVYEHTATTTPFLRSTFRWNGTGWDLRFPDGALFLFPENYRGTKSHEGAPTAMQDGRGRTIQIQRDRDATWSSLRHRLGTSFGWNMTVSPG